MLEKESEKKENTKRIEWAIVVENPLYGTRDLLSDIMRNWDAIIYISNQMKRTRMELSTPQSRVSEIGKKKSGKGIRRGPSEK